MKDELKSPTVTIEELINKVEILEARVEKINKIVNHIDLIKACEILKVRE